MKKILAIIIVFAVFASCKKLEDLNKNTKDPSTVSGESLFTGAQKRFFDQMVTCDVNNNIWRLVDQYWNETTYDDESNYNLVNRSIPDNHWNALYEHVLKNLDEAKKVITATTYTTDASPAIKQNKLAIVDVMAVHAWSVLVETFGNIPYSEALDINKLHPKYDDGLTVYEDLINRLSADIAKMDPASDGFGAADNIYGSSTFPVAEWIKYANSLKLRMGMLLADVDPSFSKTTVEAAAAGSLIQNNTDNATLTFSSAPPNTNPMYADQVANGRHDFVAAVTIIDTMNNWNDPRRALYFTQVDTSTTGTPKLAYVGGAIGLGGFYTYFSNPAAPMWKPTFQGLLFDYAEVEFLLAEAVERGYSVTGTAASHYNKGVTASIEYWEGSAADAATYLAQPNIAYNTAPGNYKQKIGMQQWIAYYNRGFEGWTEQRKMDYPALVPGVNALSDFPVRFTYPIEEQTLNGASYSTAASAIGGDVVTTKLFWDKY